MRAIALWLGLFVSVSAYALSLDQVSSKDAGDGMKQALGQGAGKSADILAPLPFLRCRPRQTPAAGCR